DQPGVCDRVRPVGGAQSARRADSDSAAGYAAVDSGAEFSAAGDGGDGGAVSDSAVRRVVGIDPADLHRAGVEYGVQRVLVDQEYSTRADGGGGCLQIELVAALHAAGVAERGDRAGVELDDVGGGRLVLSDGVRGVRV